MADEKKPEGKPVDDKPKNDPFRDIVGYIIIVLIFMAFVNSITTRVRSSQLLSRGLSGFTAEVIVKSHTRPISSLENAIGAKVISLRGTDVYSSPGERIIGKQKFRATGKILQGPVTIGELRYWYVDYDSGPDGWVKEDDIGYIVSAPNSVELIVLYFLQSIWWLKLIIILFSLICMGFVAYLIVKLTELRMNEKKLLYPQNIETALPGNAQWESILAHVESQNENDWKLAIINADIMLGEILDKLYLPGDTIGEKLKAVEKSDFTTLDNAWEAHKIRNQIAHEGPAFVLTQHEAKRVINLYRSIFEEFQII